MTHDNLLASAAPDTRMPADPAEPRLASAGDAESVLAVVRDHPASSLAWSVLARASLKSGTLAGDLAAYAYARTGYHRGLDALRRAGWRGSGPVPWEHEPNRGWLTALWSLGVAAARIGETDEADRCSQFLRDSSATAYDTLGPDRI